MTDSNSIVRSLAFGGLLMSVTAQDFVPAAFLPTNQSYFASHYRRDLNGNGRFDLVMEVLTGPNAGIYVMLDPSLTSSNATVQTVFLATSISIFGGLPQVIGFADMNADGNTDLVVEFESPFSGADILYLPGNGQGSFGSPVTLATLFSFTTSTIGDFDGNGQTDFAYVSDNGSTRNVEISLQNGGAFNTALTIGGFPGFMVAGDFDGDGDDDLALNFAGNMVVQPGGTPFGPSLPFAVVPALNLGYSQDLDRDGLEDLIVQTSSSPPWHVNVFFGDATAMLGAPVSLVPGGGPNGSNFIGPFDVDGDGRDEMLAVIRNTPGYTLIRHDGARSFSPRPYQTTMVGALIDLDLDGDLDQLVPNPTAGGYQRLENIAIYGASCAGSNGAPTLGITSPIPGSQAFSITMRQAAPNAPSGLFLSMDPQPGPCGIQLGLARMVGSVLAQTNASGEASWTFPLSAGLPDGPYALQAVSLDPTGALTVSGVTLSATHGRTVRVY